MELIGVSCLLNTQELLLNHFMRGSTTGEEEHVQSAFTPIVSRWCIYTIKQIDVQLHNLGYLESTKVNLGQILIQLWCLHDKKNQFVALTGLEYSFERSPFVVSVSHMLMHSTHLNLAIN